MSYWLVDRVLPGVAGAGVVATLSLTLHLLLHRKFLRRLVAEFAALAKQVAGQATPPREVPGGFSEHT